MMACRTFLPFINRFVLAQSRFEVILGLLRKSILWFCNPLKTS